MAMASLQALTNLSSSPNFLSSLRNPQISSTHRGPGYLKKPLIVVPKLPNFDKKKVVSFDELNNLTKTITNSPKEKKDGIIELKLNTILEAISDRIEMHHNLKEQRENWNSLLLNSVNMITLTAATMAGMSGIETGPTLGLKVSSTMLFMAATGILLIMNKMQPSQLVEEQRNAVRLFKKIQAKIETHLSIGIPTEREVEEAMEEILALDKAFPLPLLGYMLEKLPSQFEPATWWVSKGVAFDQKSSPRRDLENNNMNGWSEELEEEMREILGVIERKDKEDYVRLGNKALKFNKTLAIMGPLLTGVAAVGSGLSGHGGLVAAVAGSMASIVTTIEHGGQVGMVFEMYRSCAGFFGLLEEMVESNLEERDLGKRENGELFEMKMALHLGRSLSDLREFANKSKRNGGNVNEFGSKLF